MTRTDNLHWFCAHRVLDKGSLETIPSSCCYLHETEKNILHKKRLKNKQQGEMAEQNPEPINQHKLHGICWDPMSRTKFIRSVAVTTSRVQTDTLCPRGLGSMPPVGHRFPTLDRCLCDTNQREMGYLIQPHKNTRLLFLSKWEPDKGLVWRDWPRTQSAAETEEKYGTAKEYLTPAFCVVR